LLTRLLEPLDLAAGDLELTPAAFDALLSGAGGETSESRVYRDTRLGEAGETAHDVRLIGEYTTYSPLLGKDGVISVAHCSIYRDPRNNLLKFKDTISVSDGPIRTRKIHGEGQVRVVYQRAFLIGTYEAGYRDDPYVIILAIGASKRSPALALHGLFLGLAGDEPHLPGACRISLYRKGAYGGAFDRECGNVRTNKISTKIANKLKQGGMATLLYSWSIGDGAG
jgi:hypothetical protein